MCVRVRVCVRVHVRGQGYCLYWVQLKANNNNNNNSSSSSSNKGRVEAIAHNVA